MRFLIAGASGLIGSAVADLLVARGHRVTRLVRSRDHAHDPDAIFWNPATGDLDHHALASHDAVANFAGEPPLSLWTASKKRRIRSSRVDGTRLLADAIARTPATRRPTLFINASAVGYYGSQPRDRPVDETAAPGRGFMADVVKDWEAAARPATDAGTRVVLLRFAPVLHPDSLPLGPLARATRLGLGATLGSGRQPFPWVALDEIPAVVAFLLDHPEVQGPINVAAPDAVTNAAFTDTVARVLGRPRIFRVPALLMRAAGELGQEVLGGVTVLPARLQAAGYEWREPALEPALRRMLKT